MILSLSIQNPVANTRTAVNWVLFKKLYVNYSLNILDS